MFDVPAVGASAARNRSALGKGAVRRSFPDSGRMDRKGRSGCRAVHQQRHPRTGCEQLLGWLLTMA